LTANYELDQESSSDEEYDKDEHSDALKQVQEISKTSYSTFIQQSKEDTSKKEDEEYQNMIRHRWYIFEEDSKFLELWSYGVIWAAIYQTIMVPIELFVL
jgi:hypothetical protein